MGIPENQRDSTVQTLRSQRVIWDAAATKRGFFVRNCMRLAGRHGFLASVATFALLSLSFESPAAKAEVGPAASPAGPSDMTISALHRTALRRNAQLAQSVHTDIVRTEFGSGDQRVDRGSLRGNVQFAQSTHHDHIDHHADQGSPHWDGHNDS